jgi:aerobic carbon-monoxide dehydrogenase medium subunit
VIAASFDYVTPTRVGEAVALMREHGERARFLAGGHSLIPAMKLRRLRPQLLIDLGGIAELHGVHVGPQVVTIGALTTHGEIAASALLRSVAPLLPEAAKVVSDPLIRNRGTLGGALAQADPEGDWPAVILALDATIVAQGQQGERRIAADNFFLGPRHTALAPDEVLTAVEVPLPRTRGIYLKRMHPASGYAVVGVVVVLRRDEDGTCVEARIGVTGVGAYTLRAKAAEAQLVGSRLTAERIRAAAAVVGAQVQFIGDGQASAAYRRHLLPVYLRRAIEQVLKVGE